MNCCCFCQSILLYVVLNIAKCAKRWPAPQFRPGFHVIYTQQKGVSLMDEGPSSSRLLEQVVEQPDSECGPEGHEIASPVQIRLVEVPCHHPSKAEQRGKPSEARMN